MRNPFIAFRNVALATTAVACAQDSQTHFAHSSKPLDEAAPVVLYEFVEHAPPVSKDMPTEQVDLCAAQCVASSQGMFGACASDAYSRHQLTACRASVHDQVTACVQTACNDAAPSQDDACTVGCTNEANSIVSGCSSDADQCLAEANDVFGTCFAAECGKAGPRRVTRVVLTAMRAPRPEVAVTAAETVDEAGACDVACQAHDLAVYLDCVRERPDDQMACRAEIGRAFEVCVASHCAH